MVGSSYELMSSLEEKLGSNEKERRRKIVLKEEIKAIRYFLMMLINANELRLLIICQDYPIRA